MKFNASPRSTVGIELELQMIDASSQDLKDGIIPLLKLFPDRIDVKPEFIQSSVEITSPVCENTHEAEYYLRDTLLALKQRCSSLGMSLCGSGTHPFSEHPALITPSPRYLRMKSRYGILGRNQLTFATHVHVGMPSGDKAMFVMQHLIPCIPLLLAVSANSPFWRGLDTGFAAYRQCILAVSQTYGLPPYFEDWAEFVEFFRMSKRAQIFSSIRDIHWDIRPHPDFGTLELRVMDAASSVRTAVALAAFVRSLMVYLLDFSDTDLRQWPVSRLPRWIEQMNRYEASRDALEARYIVDRDGHVRPLIEILKHLLRLVQPVAARIGEARELRAFETLLHGHAGYQRQRAMYESSHDYRQVVRDLANDLHSNSSDDQ